MQLEYLNIELTRFPDRLRWSTQIEPGLDKALVPHLILQPLVENAIKHGVARTFAAVELKLSAARRTGQLFVTVGNEVRGVGMKPDLQEPGRGRRRACERGATARELLRIGCRPVGRATGWTVHSRAAPADRIDAMTALRVIAIDDEPLALRRLEWCLQDLPGIALVGKTGDPQRGLEMIRTLAPDVVLLDVEMPELNGFELVEHGALGKLSDARCRRSCS